MEKKRTFDFWYAVNNTEVVTMPQRHLETFGTTILTYHLVSELMDSVDQIRIRSGRMKANPPQIITPEAYAHTFLEGFGEEAHKYIEWLREHQQDVQILRYGYRLTQEAFSENLVTDNIQAVVERVQEEVRQTADPMSAVLVGVDEPWDVCLIKLFWEIIQQSAQANIKQLAQQHMFDKEGGVPHAVRQEIEKAFLAASKNNQLIPGLGKQLETYGLFDEYQDRFFALVKASKG